MLKFIWTALYRTLGIDASFTVNYRYFSYHLLEFRADYDLVRALLKSKDIDPVESAPYETRIQFVCCEMRDVQYIGNYREISVQVPVVPPYGCEEPVFSHLYLASDNEFAKWAGEAISGFPNTQGKISIKQNDKSTEVDLTMSGSPVVKLKIEDRLVMPGARIWQYIGKRKNQLVRADLSFNGNFHESEDASGCSIGLGSHPTSYELRNLMVDNTPVRIESGKSLSGFLRKPVVISAG